MLAALLRRWPQIQDQSIFSLPFFFAIFGTERIKFSLKMSVQVKENISRKADSLTQEMNETMWKHVSSQWKRIMPDFYTDMDFVMC